MIQLRLGIAAVASAVGAHTVYVHNERAKAPTGRLLQFSPGSQDDVVSDRLRTGDLVLFSRDCFLLYAAGACACAARQQFGGSEFDQAGVIVTRKGIPYVLEQTFSGPKLRRYDHRIKTSRSHEILVRPLGLSLDEAQKAAVERYLESALGSAQAAQHPESAAYEERKGVPVMRGGMAALGEAVRAVASGGNASVDLVADFYRAIGLPPAPAPAPAPTPTSSSAGLTARDLAPPSQPFSTKAASTASAAASAAASPAGGHATTNVHYKAPVWVRDLQ